MLRPLRQAKNAKNHDHWICRTYIRVAILGGQLIKNRRCIEISARRVLLPLDMFIVHLLNMEGWGGAILILLLVAENCYRCS